MAEDQTHNILVVVTAKVDFISRDEPENGGEPRHTPCGGVQFQGGGVIRKEAWALAESANDTPSIVQEMLAQTIAQLPQPVLEALGKVATKAHKGETPARIITPGAQPTVTTAAMRLHKTKPG